MTDAVPLSRVAGFFFVTFLVTWGAQLPAALAALGVLDGPVERFMPLIGLGLFGPMVGAMVMSRGEPGGIAGLFGRFRQWRAGVGWYVLALLMPAALLTIGLAANSLITGTSPDRWFYFPADPPRILAMLLVPFTEEIGWRGYALPRLQARLGALGASLLIGLLWGVWHFPMLIVQGFSAVLLLASIGYFVAGSVVFTWLCHRSGSLLPMAVVAHMGAHLDRSSASIPGDPTPFLGQFAGYAVLAIALVAFDLRAWRPLAGRSLALGLLLIGAGCRRETVADCVDGELEFEACELGPERKRLCIDGEWDEWDPCNAELHGAGRVVVLAAVDGLVGL